MNHPDGRHAERGIQVGDLRSSYLGEGWLVLTLALGFGALLAGVHVGLEQRIETNKRNETLSRIPELVLGVGVSEGARVVLQEDGLRVLTGHGETIGLRVVEREIAGHQVLEIIDREREERVGWVARGAGAGYSDRIELLIGLRPDATEITGLFVLSQRETPALGDGITRIDFRRRFVGAPADGTVEVTRDELTAARDQGRILALTAATISSRSVCDIVNRTVREVRPELTR